VIAPTNKVADNLTKKGVPAMTYHRVFGIGCRSEYTMTKRYMLDECSMVSPLDFELINSKLQSIHKSTLPFGGCTFYIFGDFAQLKPVKEELLTTSELYKLFNVLTLTQNWRQKDDPTFYNILHNIREPKICEGVNFTISKREAELLNSRVKPLPRYDGIDDLYLCATNERCDKINNKYEWVNGVKIMSNKAFNATYYDNHEKKRCRFPKNTIGILQNDNVIIDNIEYKVANIKQAFDIKIAITIHKAQGITARGNVVVDPVRMWEPAHFYVALSRATKLSNVYFTRPPIMGIKNEGGLINYYLNK
jgi:hypothetical protein